MQRSSIFSKQVDRRLIINATTFHSHHFSKRFFSVGGKLSPPVRSRSMRTRLPSFLSLILADKQPTFPQWSLVHHVRLKKKRNLDPAAQIYKWHLWEQWGEEWHGQGHPAGQGQSCEWDVGLLNPIPVYSTSVYGVWGHLWMCTILIYFAKINYWVKIKKKKVSQTHTSPCHKTDILSLTYPTWTYLPRILSSKHTNN